MARPPAALWYTYCVELLVQINLEKILFHANERLAVAGFRTVHEERVAVFRRFLKIETERMRIRHRFGLSGGEVAYGRSYLVDLIIRHACQLAVEEIDPAVSLELGDCAVVALGGYGRQELAPFSDVDLLFLQAGRRAPSGRGFVEQVLSLLWDMGLTVGHSFRTVRDCMTMAREDLTTRNLMGDARLVIGNASLFRQLTRSFDETILRNERRTEEFLRSMRLEVEARYEKFGRVGCIQGPNVKESAGGLRDMHTLLWVGRAKYGSRTLDDLCTDGHLPVADYGPARRAYEFLLRVRNEAHFATGRATDVLSLDLQPTLAANLGYGPKRGLLASELFMREYYRRAQEVNRVCERFLAIAIEGPGPSRPAVRDDGLPSTEVFEEHGCKLHLKSLPGGLRGRPALMMEAFSSAQGRGLDLSDELKGEIRGNLSLVGRQFRSSPEPAWYFLEMLRRKGKVGGALRAMHALGLLGKFLPEFGRITFLVQHDLYHRYTIDEHALKAVEALDGLAAGQDPRHLRFAKVFAEVDDAASLYLGALLHDIGKGRGGEHATKGARIAERVCHRLELDEQRAAKVVFLVRQHLLLSHVSQRRNILEDGLVERLAREIKTIERLNMLTLLTYADTSAVGPGVWTDWKEILLWDLYRRLRARLSGSRADGWDWDRADDVKQQVLRLASPDISPDDVERHFALLPERSLRPLGPERVARHIGLVERLGSAPLAVDWRPMEGAPCTELTVCARDDVWLLARLAGTLTAHGINILAVDLKTRADGIVVDTFTVCRVDVGGPIPAEREPAIEAAIREALEGRYDVAAAVEKWRAGSRPRHPRRDARPARAPVIRFDSEGSSASTVVEVVTEDKPGLAYTIAGALSALGLNITFAMIATEKNYALDVFYVTDAAGRKLDPAMLPEVERGLAAAIEGAPPGG